LLDQIIDSAGYTGGAGTLGFILVIFGIIGAIVTGIIADKTKKYKMLLIVTFTGTLGYVQSIPILTQLVPW
jgi:hypothetical protein